MKPHSRLNIPREGKRGPKRWYSANRSGKLTTDIQSGHSQPQARRTSDLRPDHRSTGDYLTVDNAEVSRMNRERLRPERSRCGRSRRFIPMAESMMVSRGGFAAYGAGQASAEEQGS